MSRAMLVLVAGLSASAFLMLDLTARAEMLPSAALDRIPSLPASADALDCETINLDSATKQPLDGLFQTEMQTQAMAMQQMVMAAPMTGPVSDAQSAAIEAANDQTLGQCGDDQMGGLMGMQPVDLKIEQAMRQIEAAHATAIQACPKPGGFVDEACARAARAASRPKVAALMASYLREAGPVFDKAAATIRQCALRREKIMADLKANKVTGAFAMMGMQYSMQSWQLVTGLLDGRKQFCDNVKRHAETFKEP